MYKILQYQKEIFERGKVKPVNLIHGEEEYLVKAFVDRLKTAYGSSLSLRWGDDLEVEDIYSLASDGSIFGDGAKKALVVLNFEDLLKKIGKSKKKLQSLIATFSKIKTAKLFLIVGRKLSEQELSKEPFRTLSSIGDIIVADKLHPRKVKEIVKRKFEKEGGGIEDEAVDLLINMCGGNLMILKQETEKLLSYADGKKITLEDVRRVCIPTESYTPFDFIDHLFSGNLQEALRSLRDILSKGTPPLQVLGLLYSYGMKLYTVSELKRAGESVDTALEFVGVKHRFAKVKFKKYLESIDSSRTARMLENLYRLDRKVKVMFSNPEKELENFVIDFILLSEPTSGGS